ncbi:MAG: ATP-binding protein [Ignavibacterium sp.]|nr:ATP-binding protein [Ignavibacterium sp.]
MKEIIKTIIADFHSRSLPEIIERNLSVPIKSGKIISIIGPRRVGKTYFLFFLINKLAEKVHRKNIIYINFEDERLDFDSSTLNLILEAYYELYPENEDELYFFFDEIQTVKNWEKFIRRVYDNVSKNIFITGSSSKLLNTEVSSSLRGRALSYELFPLSYKEYLRFKNVPFDNLSSTKTKANLIRHFNNYLLQGGFPEIIDFSEELRNKTLQSYLDVMMLRDIIERYNISNPIALKYLIKKALTNVGNYLSVNKIFNELKSIGVKVSKDSIYMFLNYIQDANLIFMTNIYSESINVQNTNDKKIYCIDNGLANSISFSLSENKGRLLENLVYLYLKSRGKNIYYSYDKKECDFVLYDKFKIIAAYQVTTELNELNKEREINGLIEAMKKYRLKKGVILTLEQKDYLKQDNLEIFIEPAWQFMLKDFSV